MPVRMTGMFHESLLDVKESIQGIMDTAENARDQAREIDAKYEREKRSAVATAIISTCNRILELIDSIDPRAVHEHAEERMPSSLCQNCGLVMKPPIPYCEFDDECLGEQEWKVAGDVNVLKKVCSRHLGPVCEAFSVIVAVTRVGGKITPEVAEEVRQSGIEFDYGLKSGQQIGDKVISQSLEDPALVEEVLADLSPEAKIALLEREHTVGDHRIPEDIAKAKAAGCPICNLPEGARGQV